MKFDWYKKEALLQQKYFTRSIPLLTPNHSYKTCHGLNVVTSTTISKKCGGKQDREGGQERYILCKIGREGKNATCCVRSGGRAGKLHAV